MQNAWNTHPTGKKRDDGGCLQTDMPLFQEDKTQIGGGMTMIVEARMISKTGRNVHFSKPPQYSPWERTCLLVGGALSQYPAISALTLHCLRVSRPVLDRFSRFLPRPESTRGLALRRPTLRSSFVPTLGRRQNTSTGQRWRYRGSMRLIDRSIYKC